MDRQREMKDKKEVQSSALRHRGKRTDTVGRRICADEAKLAAMAISLNVRLRSADMSTTMQERALRFARSLVDSVTINGRSSSSSLAHALKKEFDTSYGPAWHCVVGKSFGSFVTHSKGGFIYFSIDSLSFLLFKTEVHLVNEPPHPGSIPRDKPSTNN